MLRAAIGLMFTLSLAAGCREDRCKSAAPAFQLDVLLAAGADGGRATSLAITIDAAGLHREQSVDVTGKLADGRTSIAVSMGSKVQGGFMAEISAEARDVQARVLARGQGRYPASGDACNLFSLTLAPVGRDGGGDLPRVDVPPDRLEINRDAPRDVPRVDVKKISDVEKLRDVKKTEAVVKPDTWKPDVTVKKDAPKTPDLPLVPACSASATVVSQVGLMASCEVKGVMFVTQCDAPNACNQPAGWHICTASHYDGIYPVPIAMGPPPSAYQDAWIAGCVRQGSAPFTPIDAVCGSCSGGTATSATIQWDCNTSAPVSSTTISHVGLTTSGACSRVGVSTGLGFWTFSGTAAGPKRVLCCK